MSQEDEMRPDPPPPPAFSERAQHTDANTSGQLMPEEKASPRSTKFLVWVIGLLAVLVPIWLSARPGGFESFLPDKLLLAPCCGVFGTLLFISFIVVTSLWHYELKSRAGTGDRPWDSWRSFWLVFLLFVISVYVGLTIYPLKALFAITRSSFERMATAPPPPRTSGYIGCWHFTDFDVDPRGGQYFVTGERSDLIDGYYFGFAHKPNTQGSPFGNAYYRLEHIEGDWYAFRSNSDW